MKNTDIHLSWRTICCVLLASALASCTTPGRVERLYRDTAVTEAFANILVVGVHEDGTVRRRYERSVAAALEDAGVIAASSLSVMQTSDEISRDTLVVAAQETGADAVMITRLLSVESRAEVEQGRSTFDASPRGNVPIADFFRYDYAEYQDPMVITTVRTVVLATDLYSVATENRVWSVESTSFDKASDDAILYDVARSISRALTNDGLIP